MFSTTVYQNQQQDLEGGTGNNLRLAEFVDLLRVK